MERGVFNRFTIFSKRTFPFICFIPFFIFIIVNYTRYYFKKSKEIVQSVCHLDGHHT